VLGQQWPQALARHPGQRAVAGRLQRHVMPHSLP
jgi:hypothetical protein